MTTRRYKRLKSEQRQSSSRRERQQRGPSSARRSTMLAGVSMLAARRNFTGSPRHSGATEHYSKAKRYNRTLRLITGAAQTIYIRYREINRFIGDSQQAGKARQRMHVQRSESSSSNSSSNSERQQNVQVSKATQAAAVGPSGRSSVLSSRLRGWTTAAARHEHAQVRTPGWDPPTLRRSHGFA